MSDDHLLLHTNAKPMVPETIEDLQNWYIVGDGAREYLGKIEPNAVPNAFGLTLVSPLFMYVALDEDRKRIVHDGAGLAVPVPGVPDSGLDGLQLVLARLGHGVDRIVRIERNRFARRCVHRVARRFHGSGSHAAVAPPVVVMKGMPAEHGTSIGSTMYARSRLSRRRL